MFVFPAFFPPESGVWLILIVNSSCFQSWEYHLYAVQRLENNLKKNRKFWHTHPKTRLRLMN